jgi:hypothetical protein
MRAASLVVLVAACSGPAKGTKPPPPPEVDRAALESAVERAWSWSQNNDMSTQTWTYALRDGVVDHSMSHTMIDGDTTVSKLGAGTYEITPTGALSMHLATGDKLAFSAIVAEGEVCEALFTWPCRALGWNGYLAQDRAHTRYRREFDEVRRGEHGMQTLRAVSLLRFPRPLTEIAKGGACALELEIVTSAIVDDITVHPASGTFRFDCDITSAGKGPLWKLSVRGFTTTDDSAGTDWANFVSTRGLVDEAHDLTRELFRRAFEPVVYFDPARPDTLYFTRGAAYWSDP